MAVTLPFVSVVVPVRNGERTIGACLESLMSQDYPTARYEVIVVDNDSTDRTAELVRRCAVTYLFEGSGRSPALARNRGIQVARGEVIAFLDADCIASPTWLRCGMERFTDGVGCVAGELRAYEVRTVAQRYAESRRAYSQAWSVTEAEKPFARTANAFYRRSVFDRIGAFDGWMLTAEDMDLSWRMQDRLGLRIAYSPEAVIFHRHRESVRALLRQRQGYGYGWVQLYLKHQEQFGRRTLKHTYWDLLKLGRRLQGLAASCGGWLASGLRGKPDPEPVVLASIDVLSFLWWKLGEAQSALRHRIWYL